ncbi:28S ribosomal protein S33, mitochondrial [Coccinella septempunctata]|uniref:28S ribosomal protein S33, mitochondrial n=1 Tax=Coccinella septempunctata TaxID=41139 RepID=UPI001D07D929|nr:28S ribosomal protein S33, mitochondrial [Coccinella septempunctata]
MSNYAKYVELTKLTTEYARRMKRLSDRIFTEVARPTNPKSMKVVKLFSEKPVNLRKEVHSYYPRHPETGKLMLMLRYYGLYRDEHEDFREEMKRMRALKGKVEPERKSRKTFTNIFEGKSKQVNKKSEES